MLKVPSKLHEDKGTRRVHASVTDVATLCLTDAVSINVVYLVIEDNDHDVLTVASTEFRCDDDWAHGFPELNEK